MSGLMMALLLTASDAYVFPTQPGSDEWRALGSRQEMLAVCQIPGERLKEMSTRGLAETTLDYPMFADMLAHESMQKGFDSVASGFNGLRELMGRSDAARVLLAEYRQMDPADLKETWTLEQVGQHASRFVYLEALLAQDILLSKLTASELRDLLAEAFETSQIKRAHDGTYGALGQGSTLWLMSRILLASGSTDFQQRVREKQEIQKFLETGIFDEASAPALEEIARYTQQYLESPSRGQRHLLWLGAACLLVLALGGGLAVRFRGG